MRLVFIEPRRPAAPSLEVSPTLLRGKGIIYIFRFIVGLLNIGGMLGLGNLFSLGDFQLLGVVLELALVPLAAPMEIDGAVALR